MYRQSSLGSPDTVRGEPVICSRVCSDLSCFSQGPHSPEDCGAGGTLVRALGDVARFRGGVAHCCDGEVVLVLGEGCGFQAEILQEAQNHGHSCYMVDLH